MIRYFLCRFWLVLISLTSLCQGSKIVFTGTPTSIIEGVTPTFSLRCALENDASSNNVVKVTSIVIRRAEDNIQREVARIESGKSAVAGSWAAGGKVSGDLSNTEGHLQATWSAPKQLQAGTYRCEIVAVELDTTNIKFKSNVQVEGTSQTTGDLEQSLAEAKDEIEALKQAISDLKTKGNPVDRKSISECQHEIDALKQVVSDLQTNVGNISTAHSEQGLVVCRQSNVWGDKCKPREEAKQVLFSVPYGRIPVVSIAAVGVDVDDISKYSLKVRDLTTTGFTVVCSTWWDTLINSVEVQWTSILA